MGVGTYLERFAAKFCVEPRRECLKIFYGDPFGAKFVPNWVDRGSGASSFPFFLDLDLDLVLDLDLELSRNDSGMIPDLSPAEGVTASSSDPPFSAPGAKMTVVKQTPSN